MGKRIKLDETVLGQRYRDTTTGFEGTAPSKHEYLFGCYRITLTAPSVDGKEPVTHTVDEPALELVEAPKVTGNQRTGGDRPIFSLAR